MKECPVLRLCKAVDVSASPIEWVVDQIVPAGMLTILSGKDKTGKTVFAWEIIRAVTRGARLVEHFPVRQGPIVFLALDDPAVVTMERCDLLGLTDIEHLYFATPLDCQPNHFAFWQEVTKQVEEIKPSLIVVDALYLFIRGGGEALNQASAMGQVMQPLNTLAEATGAGVLVITHNAKGTDDVAGSFVIRAAAKQILRLKSVEGSISKRRLHVEGKLAEAREWCFDFKGPGHWKLADEEMENLTQTRAVVTTWLSSGSKGTVEAIATALSKRQADVRAVLRELVTDRIATIEKVVASGGGRPSQVYGMVSVPA